MGKNLSRYDEKVILKRAERLATLNSLIIWDYWGRDAVEYADVIIYWETDPNVIRSLTKHKRWLMGANKRFAAFLLAMRDKSLNWHKVTPEQRYKAIDALCDIYTNGKVFSDAYPEGLGKLFAETPVVDVTES
jgi:hypothetical protein